MNSNKPGTRDVELVVVTENARGKIDFLPVRVSVTEEEVREGMHFVAATSMASRAGVRVLKAMDESHPAFHQVKDARKFEKFFDDATLVLQDALAGRHVEPERTIQQVRELYESFGDEMLYMAVSSEGFWSVKTQGWVESASEATFFRNPEVINRLRASGPVRMAAYPIRVVAQTGMRDLPPSPQIVAAAREALRVCKLLGKQVDESNSEEMLLLQLQAERIEVPEHGKVLLKPLMEAVRQQIAASQAINFDKPAAARPMRQAA